MFLFITAIILAVIGLGFIAFKFFSEYVWPLWVGIGVVALAVGAFIMSTYWANGQ